MMEREIVGQRRNGKAARRAAKKGVVVPRYFTTPGVDPADELAWEHRTAAITGEDGKPIFEQKDIEVPKCWSPLATNVVSSKYFRGTLGTPERERSVRQLIGRVVTPSPPGAARTATSPPRRTPTLPRRADPPPPTGRRWPSTRRSGSTSASRSTRSARACFINSVDDSMESILDLAKTEGMLFKFGSGTGSQPLHRSAPPRSSWPAAARPRARSAS